MHEVQSFLKFLGEVYAVFGLDYTMALSTRPEGYLGELELWNKCAHNQQRYYRAPQRFFLADCCSCAAQLPTLLCPLPLCVKQLCNCSS